MEVQGPPWLRRKCDAGLGCVRTPLHTDTQRKDRKEQDGWDFSVLQRLPLGLRLPELSLSQVSPR